MSLLAQNLSLVMTVLNLKALTRSPRIQGSIQLFSDDFLKKSLPKDIFIEFRVGEERDRERQRETEREGNIDVRKKHCLVASLCTLTGEQILTLGMCSDHHLWCMG